MPLYFWFIVCTALSFSVRANTGDQTEVIYERALTDLYHLSSAQMQGREHDTQGSEIAQQYLIRRFAESAVKAFNQYPDYKQAFSFKRALTQIDGTNIIGYMSNSDTPKPHPKYIVITAHYDHLGIQSGKLFYGADDNASGVAAMLAIASFLPMIDLHHSIIFLATDAEEKGLIGARVALDYFPIELSQIVFNLNLDMIAQVGKPAKIHLSGSRSAPQFKILVEDTRRRLTDSSVKLMGEHRSQRKRTSMLGKVDYRRASDHAVFIQHDIPFLYLGVKAHRFYHTEHDSYERINQTHFLQVINIVKQVLITADLAMAEKQVSVRVPVSAQTR